MSTNEYGYIGAGPTQSSSSNTGVFDNEDVYNLLDEGKWALQIIDGVSYLVIAGGGGGRGAIPQTMEVEVLEVQEVIETLMHQKLQVELTLQQKHQSQF